MAESKVIIADGEGKLPDSRVPDRLTEEGLLTFVSDNTLLLDSRPKNAPAFGLFFPDRDWET